MIESIHIKNFRGIQDGKIDRFSKINLLVGPNNSGKSAVLETIYLANTASRPASLQVQGILREVMIAERDLLESDPMQRVCERHLKKMQNMGLPQRFRTKGIPPLDLDLLSAVSIPNKPAASVSLFSLSEMDIAAAYTLEQMGHNSGSTYTFRTSLMEGDFRESDGVSGFISIHCWEKGLTHFQRGDARWMIKGLLPWASNTLFFDVQNMVSHLPFEFFRAMKDSIPGWSLKIGNRFKRLFDIKENFHVGFWQPPEAAHLTQGSIELEDKIALTIDDYGDGSRSAFKLLTPLIALSELAEQLKPGVLLWEEPELFQNPQSLGKLLAEVSELIKDKPIQLFIATHSIEVVAQFVRLVNEKAIKADDLLAIRLNLQNGQLASSAFNHEEIQQWTAMNLDLRVPSGEVDSPLRFQFKESVNDEAEN